MRFFPRRSRNVFAAVHDTFMTAASMMLAFYLRGGIAYIDAKAHWLLPGISIFTALTMLILLSFRIYRGLWRYASMRDLLTITKAVTLAVIIFYSGAFLFNRLEGIPRSIPAINWLVLLFLLGAPRFIYRMVKDRLLGVPFSWKDGSRIPVLVIGANETTEHFLRNSERSPDAAYSVVAILDNNPQIAGRMMYGVRIYGNVEDLPKVIHKLTKRDSKPQRIIVADNTLNGPAMRHLLDMADKEGLKVARLPNITDFKSGMAEKMQIRDIDVEDLLGRPQNIHDKSEMHQLVAGKRVLVTGAGGTIGSELVRQLASFKPASILLFEQGEFNLYQIDHELANRFSTLSRRAVIADIRDASYVEHIFADYQPQLVFHAAAIKHVPLAEDNITEALLTNVLGTKNIADACVRYKVEAMVMISTDKAVNPANVMGASKRLAETYAQALGSDEKAGKLTRFITVRFGNVLGSTGSVVPLFEKQLKAGGPITVTHPDMVRYFMTVREAVELVLQAATLGARQEESRNGLIFVLDMGQPVRIEELAIQMIRLAGLKPHDDIKIAYSGLRPGEKLYEELFYYSESSLKTDHEGIMISSSRRVELDELLPELEQLASLCKVRNHQAALSLLHKLVPEFRHASTIE